MNFSYDPSIYETNKMPFRVKEKLEKFWKPLTRTYEAPPEYVNIGKDEIFLGFEPWDEEYETKVTIPYPKNRRMTAIVCGGQGSGKTVFKDILAIDNLHHRFGHPILYFDFKDDSSKLLKPNTNPYLVNILNKYKIKPKKYDFMSVSAKYMRLDGRAKKAGNEITISLADFEEMDADVRIAMFCKILEIERGEPAYAIISQIFSHEEIPLTLMDLAVEIEKLTSNSEKKLKSDRILWKLDELINTRKLSDNHFSYSKALKEKGMVVFEGTVADESIAGDLMQGIFVNNAIYDVVGGRKHGTLDKIPYIVTEEANVVGGKGGLSSGILTALSTKYREIAGKAGVGSIIITQFLHEIPDKIVSEAEYIFTPKMFNEKDIELIKNRGSDNYIFDEMHYDPNAKPNTFAVFGRNGLTDYQLFNPHPRASSMNTT